MSAFFYIVANRELNLAKYGFSERVHSRIAFWKDRGFDETVALKEFESTELARGYEREFGRYVDFNNFSGNWHEMYDAWKEMQGKANHHGFLAGKSEAFFADRLEPDILSNLLIRTVADLATENDLNNRVFQQETLKQNIPVGKIVGYDDFRNAFGHIVGTCGLTPKAFIDMGVRSGLLMQIAIPKEYRRKIGINKSRILDLLFHDSRATYDSGSRHQFIRIDPNLAGLMEVDVLTEEMIFGMLIQLRQQYLATQGA